MLTGELRSQVDAIWNAFWSGGIANPIEVIEQITYLLFLRRLDDLHTVEERKVDRQDNTTVAVARVIHAPQRAASEARTEISGAGGPTPPPAPSTMCGRTRTSDWPP